MDQLFRRKHLQMKVFTVSGKDNTLEENIHFFTLVDFVFLFEIVGGFPALRNLRSTLSNLHKDVRCECHLSHMCIHTHNSLAFVFSECGLPVWFESLLTATSLL